MVKKQKTEIMDVKRYKDRWKISFSNRKEGNYKNDSREYTDLDQANDKYLLRLWVAMGGKL